MISRTTKIVRQLLKVEVASQEFQNIYKTILKATKTKYPTITLQDEKKKGRSNLYIFSVDKYFRNEIVNKDTAGINKKMNILNKSVKSVKGLEDSWVAKDKQFGTISFIVKVKQ